MVLTKFLENYQVSYLFLAVLSPEIIIYSGDLLEDVI